jgi:hypothetical protein
MKSTGEVMGIDTSFEIAFAKSQIGGGTNLPRNGTVFVSVKDADKPRILDAVRLLASLGFKTIATSGTQRYLAEHGVEAAKVFKVLEGRPHIVDAIKNGGVQLVFNTTEGTAALADSRSMRHAALLHKVPYYTTLSGAVAAAQGIKAYLGGDLEVRALQSYFSDRTSGRFSWVLPAQAAARVRPGSPRSRTGETGRGRGFFDRPSVDMTPVRVNPWPESYCEWIGRFFEGGRSLAALTRDQNVSGARQEEK